MREILVKAEGLQCYYAQKQQKIDGHYLPIRAVDGVSFELRRGETLGVIGESGCGKSTLGRLLVQLDKSTGGTLILSGEDAEKLCQKNPLAFRRKAQIVFQNPYDAFNPRFSILKSMLRPLKIHHIGNSDAQREHLCAQALESSGLAPAKDYLSRYPHELSGGQLQRISILRSMMLSPEYMVADEPVSMLDVSLRAEVMNLLSVLKTEKKMAMVFISHDIATTRAIADRIMVMYLGRVVETGETDRVLHHPMHPYTQALISNCGMLSADGFAPIVISGEPPVPIGKAKGCPFAQRCFRTCPECWQNDPPLIEVEPGHQAACLTPKTYEQYKGEN